MQQAPVIVVGAGVGGLSAAALLAARGIDVRVVESGSGPGGKVRTVPVGGTDIDAGPSVLTMRWVFEEMFAACGGVLGDEVGLVRAETLARHAWNDGAMLDLFADEAASADAIGIFAGAAEARGYRDFCAEARRIYEVLEAPFLRAQRPSLPALMYRVGPIQIARALGVRPYMSLWRALGGHFRDPRLQQLFGRYATYCGSSPFAAAATLMLVAHVEQSGVWMVDGGMHAMARGLERLATRAGAVFRYGQACARIHVGDRRAAGVELASGEVLAASAVVYNGDPAALGELLGESARHAGVSIPAAARSLSAMTWLVRGKASGFPLVRHNVFFSPDYRREFDDIFLRGRFPETPSVYVCAQDRDDHSARAPPGGERLQFIVNAPANGDRRQFDQRETDACQARTTATLRACGLELEPTAPPVVTTPRDFAERFPGTGGAIYGRASHGWMASFQRPAAATRIAGLYLAGGGTHPGPGMPMAALSGRLAAEQLMADRAST